MIWKSVTGESTGIYNKEFLWRTASGYKFQIVSKMMWKAYTQINNPPKKIDWDYVEEVEMLPEEDFLQTDYNF